MTYWYEDPDHHKDAWHWMGIAISLAQTLGLHRDPNSTGIRTAKQGLWKRIWWSCFIRDRFISLGMRCPARIQDNDCDVPMLVESDFDIQVLAEGNTAIPRDCIMVRSVAMQRELASMCIEQARLSVCIGHILKAQYSSSIRPGVNPGYTATSRMMLLPTSCVDNEAAITAADLELKAWTQSLPLSCQYQRLGPAGNETGRSSILVQRTLLHMVYHTAVATLHRPLLFTSRSDTSSPPRRINESSYMRVRAAAAQVSCMAMELHDYQLDRYLPATAVTVILSAAVTHLLEMKSTAAWERNRASDLFRQGLCIMETLGEIYLAADHATEFLYAAQRKMMFDIDDIVGHCGATKGPPRRRVQQLSASYVIPSGHYKSAASQTDDGKHSSIPNSMDDLDDSMNTIDLAFAPFCGDNDLNATTGATFDLDDWLRFSPQLGNGQEQDAVCDYFGKTCRSWIDSGKADVLPSSETVASSSVKAIR